MSKGNAFLLGVVVGASVGIVITGLPWWTGVLTGAIIIAFSRVFVP